MLNPMFENIKAYLAARDQQLFEVTTGVINDVLLQVALKVCNIS